MGIRERIRDAGIKASNKVAELSALSPEQVEQIQNAREIYLAEKPDPNDPAAVKTTQRMMAANSVEIFNAYLPQIRDLYYPVDRRAEYGEEFRTDNNIRYINLTRWVTNKEENNLEKLVNVYEVLSNEACNIALVFHREVHETQVYLAVVNTKNATNNVTANDYISRLTDAIRGNFPGAEWQKEIGYGILPCMQGNSPCAVAAATNIPTEKSKQFVSQTVEKLLDGIIPSNKKQEYTLILLATPVIDVEERKAILSEIYSGLAPYAGWSTSFQYSESKSENSSAVFGVNVGASAGVQNGINTSRATSNGTTDNSSQTISENSSDTETNSVADSQSDASGRTISDSNSSSFSEAKGKSVAEGTSHSSGHNSSYGINNSESSNINVGVTANQSVTTGVETGVHVDAGPVGVNASTNVNATVGLSENVNTGHTTETGTSTSFGNSTSDSTSHNITQTATQSTAESAAHSIAESATRTIAQSTSRAVASTVGKTIANTLGKAVSNTVTNTVGLSKAVNFGTNFGANFARSSNVTATIGKNETINQTFTNYAVKHALETLEKQMKRFEQSTALGMWDFAAYVMSEDFNIANNVAHSYLALTQGEESHVSKASINLWRGDLGTTRDAVSEICGYLRELRHPVFGFNPGILKADSEFYFYPSVVTATTSLTGKELAYSLNFPRKSIAGLPVIECAEFGRNISTYDKRPETDRTVELGRIFHMNHEENLPVSISLDSLTSHLFITGSTGSGKSNTIYHILDEAAQQQVKFLVVEPAKGEYKNVFGNAPDVSVYGTNPKLMPLLRVNPFSFPDGIHVFEHIDRLTEIFNVCWPMYAAMPAVLKSAVEKSYEDCGWDLILSENPYGEDLYPTFKDVARNVKEIIESSEYDAENKGAYKGSLLTRLTSLTNGINGLVFTGNEIPAEQLFDENVIIDLSRVGSSETKSLLMGMLVLKLQEYRMSSAKGMNAGLQHITVLEEVHNLLKRTSTESSSESGNLAGKSVEMISNAIAEMRTYGEGFIIADQAPGLLDMAAIRNTNTKLIMRLPDLTDRKLVGKAANLNDDQITELAKLPRGVAAVYQHEWIQPVLCKIEKYKTSNTGFIYEPQYIESDPDDQAYKLHIATLLSKGTAVGREIVMTDIRNHLKEMHLPASVQVDIMRTLINPPRAVQMINLGNDMNALFPTITESVRDSFKRGFSPEEWTISAEQALSVYVDESIDNQVRRDIIQSILTHYLFTEMHNEAALLEWKQRGNLV